MLPDPADPRLRVYRTGDLARLAEDGVFLLLGRTDRQAKMNSQFVDLAHIEVVLRPVPKVARVAAVAREGAEGTRLFAFVEPAPGADAGPPDILRAAARAGLPALMRPARIVLRDVLPLLAGGKVDERRLIDDAAADGG